MKKIVYKSIFSIVIVLFAFLMLPNKQVKAQEEQIFPEVIMKVPYYHANHENTYTMTYEFIIQYRLDNLIFPLNDNLNEYDYFLLVKTGLPIQKGITSTALATPAYELEDIQIEDNYTIFFVRIILPKQIVDSIYSGIENMLTFFRDDSAFYIKYDVYQYGYDLGYMVGYGDGYERGLEEGYTEGYIVGYEKGSENGYNVGYEIGSENGYNVGYEIGYDEGHYDGYDLGYINGRDEGYNNGYNAGLEDGYNQGYDEGYSLGNTDGFEDGFVLGREHGYNEGVKAGEKSKIAQKNEAFYKSIEKWLVPAIITVIVLGGIVSIIAIKRREQ